jgi:hypothetical protein
MPSVSPPQALAEVIPVGLSRPGDLGAALQAPAAAEHEYGELVVAEDVAVVDELGGRAFGDERGGRVVAVAWQ